MQNHKIGTNMNLYMKIEALNNFLNHRQRYTVVLITPVRGPLVSYISVLFSDQK